MKKKFFLIPLTLIISLMMVSCLVVTEKSYLDGITSVKTLSSGHEVDGVYYVFGGNLLKNSIIVNGYYSGSTGINIKDNAAIWARKTGSYTDVKVTDYLIINAGEEYTVWSVFNGIKSNTITVKGAAAYELLEASSDRRGIYLKGATIDDMGSITVVYYDSEGSLHSGNMMSALNSDRFLVWQMSDRTTAINALSNTVNPLSEKCRYLKVSFKGSDSSVLIPVTKIVDLEKDTGWDVIVTGGFSSYGTKASTDTRCSSVSMYILYDSVLLKVLSKRTDDGCTALAITKDSEGVITSSKLRNGWKIEILKDAGDTVKQTFDTTDEEVEVNLPSDEYTIRVTCTSPEKYGLPSGVTITGQHDFTVK